MDVSITKHGVDGECMQVVFFVRQLSQHATCSTSRTWKAASGVSNNRRFPVSKQTGLWQSIPRLRDVIACYSELDKCKTSERLCLLFKWSTFIRLIDAEDATRSDLYVHRATNVSIVTNVSSPATYCCALGGRNMYLSVINN